MTTTDYLTEALNACAGASAEARAWLAAASDEVRGGVQEARFAALLALASRHFRGQRPLAAPRSPEGPAGFQPERWTALETARVLLVLARPDLADESGARGIEEAFRYADEGELCALYRSLAHLPDAGRFAWRAGEGCRTNMRTVFEAVALDTPFPREHFDEVAFNQAAIKAVFVEAPLWRLYGLDERGGPELARMALDLCEERRSAGRAVQHELWLCVGAAGGERAVASIEAELEVSDPRARCAAGIALVRAGASDRLEARLAGETSPFVSARWRAALAGPNGASQWAFRELDRGAELPFD